METIGSSKMLMRFGLKTRMGLKGSGLRAFVKYLRVFSEKGGKIMRTGFWDTLYYDPK